MRDIARAMRDDAAVNDVRSMLREEDRRKRRRRTIAAVLCIVALAAVCGLIAGLVLAIG